MDGGRPTSYISLYHLFDEHIYISKRDRRGVYNKVIVRSALSKIPRNFSDFLKNDDNKTRLIELIKDEFVKHSQNYLLQLLSSEVIYFSIDGLCLQIKQERVIEASQLSSNQEETDTKVLLHANHVLHENIDQNFVLRSPSGDIDINILCIAMFPLQAERIWIDYGTGDNRKVLKLNSIDMGEEKKLALLGFHAATGNDYVSSFFRRGKKKAWKLVEKYSRFKTMFSSLGNSWEINENNLRVFEEFVFHLYGGKEKSVDKLRYNKFEAVYRKKNKIQDLSLLPPCLRSLLLHLKRSNYIARIWKLCFQAVIDFQDISNHDWNSDGTINWTTEEFPDDVVEILTAEDEDEIAPIDEPDDSDEDSDEDNDE